LDWRVRNDNLLGFARFTFAIVFLHFFRVVWNQSIIGFFFPLCLFSSKELARNDFSEMLNGCWLCWQENGVIKGMEDMPQASAEVIYFSLPCNFVNSYRQNNPYHFSLACWISQFQENGTQGTTEKSRPTRKRRRDPVADVSSLEPRTMRARKRRNAPMQKDETKKEKVEALTFSCLLYSHSSVICIH
jgi:hypothetical protein